MEVHQLYIHPIKSLRSVPVSCAQLTSVGFPHDRRFILLRQHSAQPPLSSAATNGVNGRSSNGEIEGAAANGGDPAAPTKKLPVRWKPHYNPQTGMENMTITYYAELALFTQKIDEHMGADELAEHGETHGAPTTFTVRYHPPSSPMPQRNTQREGETGVSDTASSIKIPLEPNLDSWSQSRRQERLKEQDPDMREINIPLHNSPTKAFVMPKRINDWFSEQFGWKVILAYLGPNRRESLGNLDPYWPAGTNNSDKTSSSWMSSSLSGFKLWSSEKQQDKEEEKVLTLTDVAPFLVVTTESLADVSSRLPEGVDMDVTKFRPNIVLSGAKGAYEEDFWGGVKLSTTPSPFAEEEATASSAEIFLTANCGRCQSINVDFGTGQRADGELGKVLGKLSKDRRVDPGNKYSPIFGRYGFLKKDDRQVDKDKEIWLRVGAKAEVSISNDERTKFYWPGIGTTS